MSSLRLMLAEQLKFSDPENASAIQMVLTLASRELATLFKPAKFEEEPITSALAGAIASHATWVVSLFEKDPNLAPRIYWGHYEKNTPAKKTKNNEGESENDKATTEAQSGADFALVLRIGEEHALLGLFQAKRASIEKMNSVHVNFFQRPKISKREGVARRPSQMITFANYGYELFMRLRKIQERKAMSVNEDDYAAALSWVHYLIYRNGEPWCAAMSKLETPLKGQQNNQGTMTSQSVELYLDDVRRFSDLIDLSKLTLDPVTGQPELPGWLSMRFSKARRLLPELHDLTGAGIYVADDEGSGSGAMELDTMHGEVVKSKVKSAENSLLKGLFSKIEGQISQQAQRQLIQSTSSTSQDGASGQKAGRKTTP